MKNIIVTLFLALPLAASAGELKEVKNKRSPTNSSSGGCFDPRAVSVQCEEGTIFKGWHKGDCKGKLVAGAICEEECFDPRVALIKCEEGMVFKGWIKGRCKGVLVERADCAQD